jgi:hypothetical protein
MCANERALFSVSFVDGTAHVGRDMTRVLRAALRAGLRCGLRNGRVTPLLDALDQRIQRAIEDLGDVTRRDGVRQ